MENGETNCITTSTRRNPVTEVFRQWCQVGAQVRHLAAIKINLNAADYLLRGDHIHALRQVSNGIRAKVLWQILFIAISQGQHPRFPATTRSTTRQSANGMNELVLGVSFPVRWLAAAGNHHTWPGCRSPFFGWNCGC